MPANRNNGNSDSVLHSNEVAGSRLELLLFHTSDQQLFGINVFKVQEIIPYQRLTKVPGAHPHVCGLAHLRGRNMPIIDLSRAIGKPPFDDVSKTQIIITEHNRSVHGFLVGGVSRIVNTQWDQVLPTPKPVGKEAYMTAIVRVDGQLIEILDVERVYDEVASVDTHVSSEFASREHPPEMRVFVVDDSHVARKQIRRALEQIGVECDSSSNGKEAYQHLQKLQDEGEDIARYYAMVISDIEMPEMDGYQLTSAIRANAGMAGVYILLHSSISGVFNRDMVARTGANQFIQKYSANDLANAVLEHTGDNIQSP